MLIRPYQHGDPAADHIAGIYLEFGLAFDPDFEDDLYDIPRVYSQGLFLVAEEGGRLLATGAVVPNGGQRLIRRMYVATAARRRGLASQLLTQLMAWGDYSGTELWSDVRFRSAHAMYRRAGFQPGPLRILEDPDRSVERYFWHQRR
jgi:GNAT superfamily N-acetyltransferase